MQKWALIGLLVVQMHFAASYLVPLDLKGKTGKHDLCLRFAQPGLDPLWVIDSVRLVGGAR